VGRLAADASAHGPPAAPVAPGGMGSSRRARRRALRPAAAGIGDCAASRRFAQRRLPAGARALPARMTQAAHPLAPEVRLVSTRDLAWLIGSLLIVIAPHTLRAPWWLTVLTLCLFGWRFYCTLNRAPLPSRWLVIGIAAVAMLGIWLEIRTLFGRQPGIILLTLFAGLKLLETRSNRDAAVAAFLGYFLIITNFLYTQSMLTAIVISGAVSTAPAPPLRSSA